MLTVLHQSLERHLRLRERNEYGFLFVVEGARIAEAANFLSVQLEPLDVGGYPPSWQDEKGPVLLARTWDEDFRVRNFEVCFLT